ncbi:flagellar biosynthesis protein FliP [Oerskovia turbata]|uniref:Flagellar biosynthetic protein FliP n=1 Tax=Oerskovia turbata TaxID=1713 RepID=A0A4Q1KUS2_9CELL|nr:flagellar type III secretion system pore protein FliP [Oerskovia turbata]RXR23634.1 flagellar biosynthesis protein FliP [Oerskovia turbata]RXR32904.1 flagellar biosynthesis protein FliP [Oerskovia turbata]TGJ95202.1 flagellar biosynthetic protein FliP [Actinotalea fermentans ATCC 43279 = JCM 9966 = DSM 3133]
MTVVVPVRRQAHRAVALATALVLVVLVLVTAVLLAPSASAAPTDPTAPTAPVDPTAPDGGSSFSVEINGPNGEPSSSLVTLVGITLLSLAPTLLLMMTSFTKIFVVLSLTRNALGTGTVPPNMVLAGLALFLSMFIMWPVFGEINEAAVQPYLAGTTTFSQALDAGSEPLREFMLAHTREEDLALMTRAADLDNPATMADVPLTTLVPAFVISELRAAFIIGFVIFVPFLVIDLVVAAALMSMGMMMLPPTMISLPFKLLLFVLVDGWGLITTSLIGSYGVG